MKRSVKSTLWVLVTVFACSLCFFSCTDQKTQVKPDLSISEVKNLMSKELPAGVYAKVKDIDESKFTSVSRSYFGNNTSSESLVRGLNSLGTNSSPVGERLVYGSTSFLGGRAFGEDPPNRRVSFYSNQNNGSFFNAYNGRVDVSYYQNQSGNVSNFQFGSQVSIDVFGVNSGTYTQTGNVSSTYTMSDGSTVLVFEVRGTYSPAVLGLAGLSNNWVFTGYIVFNPNNFIQIASATMKIAREGYD